MMMNDADFDSFCADYRTMHEEWMWRLGLQWWQFSFEFFRGAIPGANEDCTADVRPSWQYQAAKVRVNITGWAGLEDIEREGVVAHEMVHCLLSFLYAKSWGDRSRRSQQAEEHVATTLGRALLGRMEKPEGKPEEKAPLHEHVFYTRAGENLPKCDCGLYWEGEGVTLRGSVRETAEQLAKQRIAASEALFSKEAVSKAILHSQGGRYVDIG